MGQPSIKSFSNPFHNSTFFSSIKQDPPTTEQTSTKSFPNPFKNFTLFSSSKGATAPPAPDSPTEQTSTKSLPNPFKNLTLLSSIKRATSRPAPPPPHMDPSPQPSIFSTLRKPPVAKPTDFIPIFNECVSTAASRTQDFLLFKDPEEKFHPSPEALTQVFLMTYISQSVARDLTPTFSCTAMTPEQRVLLGADWVWALLEKPSKTPRIQIAVQVLHLTEREGGPAGGSGGGGGGGGADEPRSESLQMAQREASGRNAPEKMVEFCSSVGADCYALFLLLGRASDRRNIYGVLSNNLGAARGRCGAIDRALIDNFFKGSRYLHTAAGMMHAVLSKRDGDALTLMIKFT